MRLKSFISRRKTVVLTTCCRVQPPVSRIACRFLSACLVSASTPPATMAPVAGSKPSWPETNNNCPALTPSEYGPMTLGPLTGATICFSMKNSFASVFLIVYDVDPNENRHRGNRTSNILALIRRRPLPRPLPTEWGGEKEERGDFDGT